MSEYIVIAQNVPLKESSKVPRGTDIFYRCDFCHVIVPSLPREKIVACACRRLDVDLTMLRLGYDEEYFSVLEKRDTPK